LTLTVWYCGWKRVLFQPQFIAVWKTFWTQILKMSPTKNWVCTVGFGEAKNYCFSLFIAYLLPYVQGELIHSPQCSLQEVNTAKWINSLGIVHVNSSRWINSRVTVHMNSDSIVHWTTSDPKKIYLFLIVFYSKTSI